MNRVVRANALFKDATFAQPLSKNTSLSVRILVLTPWYYPFVHPRAYRWTHLTTHWAEQGHEVHVVCARQRDFARTHRHKGVWVHRAGFDSLKEAVFYAFRPTTVRGRIGAGATPPGWLQRGLSAIYKNVWKNLCFPDDAWQWYWPACRLARALHQQQQFDMVVSVSLPFTAHRVGHYLKRRYPALRWIADVGDPYSLRPGPLSNPLYAAAGRRLERSTLAEADAVVVTNPAAADVYQQQFGVLPQRLHVIPPLWNDFPDAALSDLVALRAGWHAGYFGAFYAPIRTPQALAGLIWETFAQRPDLRTRLFFHFFGEIFPEFWHMLRRLPNTTLHGLCPPAHAYAYMRRMRVLISVGNTTTWQLPSKAVSYLAAGRPVVHLSYVEPDALVRFWSDRPNLLVLRVQGDRVPTAEVERWLAFLENPPAALDNVDQQVAPFRTEALAAAYINAAGW